MTEVVEITPSTPSKVKTTEWTLVPPQSMRKKMRERFLKTEERKKPVTRRLFRLLIKKRGFKAYPPYLDDIYDQYVKDSDLLEHFNNWFFKGQTAGTYFKECMAYVQENNENNIFFIYGIIRGGKSRVGRHVILVGNEISGKHARYHVDPLKPDMCSLYYIGKPFVAALDGVDMNLPVELVADDYCTINFSQSQKIVPLMNAEDWLIQDEMPDSRGEGSRNILKDIKNLLKIASGKRRLNFVFLNPTRVEMDNVKLYIHIVATDKQKKRTLAILEAYTSTKPPTLKTRGIIVFNVDEPEHLTNEYEISSANIKKVYQDKSGSSLVEANIQLVHDIVNSVFNMSPEQRDFIGDVIKSKEAFNAWLDIDPDLQEAANSPRRTSIVALAYNKYKNVLEARKKGNESGQAPGEQYNYRVDDQGHFIFDQMEFLKKKFVPGTVTDRDFEIWRMGEEGASAEKIQKVLKIKIGRSRISQIQAATKEAMGDGGDASQAMGDDYELYLEPKLTARYPDGKVIHGGKKSEFDFLITFPANEKRFIVVSAKCSDKADRRIYYPPEDLDPEIKKARELAGDGIDVQCILNVYDEVTFTMHEQLIPFDQDPLPRNFIFDLPSPDKPGDEAPGDPEEDKDLEPVADGE